MRQIILDTETTGMDPHQGDRLVEIGCVEVMNYVPTGRTYHVYINPEREVPAEAVAVHGLTTQFLKDKPYFSQIYTDFLDFVAEGHLVIHNAEFDMKFINAELRKVGHKPIPDKRVTDTLALARRKFPGSPASLDALCRRFGIDNSAREYHGALLDAQLLAEVYLEMMGGRQHGLGLSSESNIIQNDQGMMISQHAARVREFRPARPHAPNPEELAAHALLLTQLKDPIWNG